MKRIRCSAALLLILYLSSPAHAQNAVWRGTTTSTDWNTPANWSTDEVPTGQANFGTSGGKSVTFSQNTTIGTPLQFNAPRYIFDQSGPQVTIDGNGISASIANAPAFDVRSEAHLFFTNSSTAGPATFDVTDLANMTFRDTSSAGTATITAGVRNDPSGGFNAGTIMFRGNSTADHATITAEVQADIEFHEGSSAGNATLTANRDGVISFDTISTGANARFITNAGGVVDISA
jgi:hypothetical protein